MIRLGVTRLQNKLQFLYPVLSGLTEVVMFTLCLSKFKNWRYASCCC